MLEGGFQDSELEMRPQEGRERSQYLPQGRKRGSGTIPSAKSLGAAGSWTSWHRGRTKAPESPKPQVPEGVITPKATGPRISHKHPLLHCGAWHWRYKRERGIWGSQGRSFLRALGSQGLLGSGFMISHSLGKTPVLTLSMA